MILEARGLGKRFTSFNALENVSLQVEEGDILGIIGESGAGKSTLLRCLSSLESISSGEVLFLGAPFPFQDKQALRQVRKQIGMIFQHFHLLNSRSVLDNVCLPLELNKEKDRKEKAYELLKLVGLESKAALFPATLSGGEKQRVAIARALIANPKVLFCDEATSALDPKTTAEILTLLKGLQQKLGITIILITHEMALVRKICNKVLILKEGRVVESGYAADVFSNPKHQVTQELLQNSVHELDLIALKESHPHLSFMTLHFKGEAAEKPILSRLISSLGIEINILSGWMDKVHDISVGSLTVALKEENVNEALLFLKENQVAYDILLRGRS